MKPWLALPRERQQLSFFNYLAWSLGVRTSIDWQSVSLAYPKLNSVRDRQSRHRLG